MKTNTKFLTAFSTLLLCLTFTSCSKCEWKVGDLSEAPTFKKQEFFDFEKSAIKRGFMVRDAETNNDPFGCTFYESQVNVSKETGLELKLEKTLDETKILNESKDPYLGGEIKTAGSYKYGYYSTVMKPSNVEGTASTFFLYCNNPHDEIDIEFLGKDTTKVQFNFFTNNVGNHEKWYDLGFDASEDFHEYGFYWAEKEITWYVDGQPVYRVVGDVPTAACQIYTNLWSGSTKNSGIVAWMGNVTEHESQLPAKAHYKAFYVADLDGKELTNKPQGRDYDVLPTDDQLSARTVTLASKSSEYKLTEDAGAFTITYQNVSPSTWKNALFNVSNIATNKWFALKIKNNGSYAYDMHTRICMRNTKGNVTVTSAWRNGSTDGISITNTSEVHLDIPAQQEAIVVIRYYAVSVTSFSIMFDSTTGTWEPRSGNVTISDFRAGGIQDSTEERTDDIPEEIFE